MDEKNNSYKRSLNRSTDLRILVQARENLFINHGGDTVALESSNEALRNLGVEVVLDIQGKENPKNFDLVHIYNFSTPQAIEQFAINAVEKDVPFVVTTLYEDRINFFTHMHIYASLILHIESSREKISWEQYKQYALNTLNDTKNIVNIDNQIAATYAKVLISSGIKESYLLRRDFPNSKNIESCFFGSSRLPKVSKKLFEEKYNIKDYILSVGRIEVRKNQGMLLYALKDEDIPIVLVAGKMTYNPDYEECISRFKRKGRTIVVKNLSPEMLASAYAGAKVHALPSWYELPGLVSLEAAINGANVVASNYGTIDSYLSNTINYCEPDCIYSIKNAVLNAYNSKPNASLQELAASFTWESTARRLISIYEYALKKNEVPSSNKSIKIEVNNSSSKIIRELNLKNNELLTT